MAQQNSTYHSSPRDDSKPRNLPNYNYTPWQSQPAIAQDMMRHLSSDSAYFSSQNPDEVYSPKNSPPTMPYGALSPIIYEDESYSTQQYPSTPYLASSPALVRPNSDRSTSSRATPSSLGLEDVSDLTAYKFVVQKGKEPYFELKQELASYVSADVPMRIYLDSPANPQKNIFPCQYPACQEKIFKRPADLERHYRNVHAPLDQKDQFPCDYVPCQRIRDPFTRKDHFRDHLRDYHKEDLGCAKGEKIYERKKWLKLQEAWIAERKIVGSWWRCPKCLHRVQIAESRWECPGPDCKNTCDRERADRIEAVRAKAAASTPSGVDDDHVNYGTGPTTYPINCVACGDTAWILDVNANRWDACPTCQPSVEHDYKTDSEWGISTGSMWS